MVAAVAVDSEANKHALRLAEGASEKQTVVKDLLQSLVERGVEPEHRCLLVIDGSEASRTPIDQVYRVDSPLQRCYKHKLNNVLHYLPKNHKPHVQATIKAADKLPTKQGVACLLKQAHWLDVEYRSAATSLREGLAETFTANKLALAPELRVACIRPIIYNENSMLRLPTRSIARWRCSDGPIVSRSSFPRRRKELPPNKMYYKRVLTLQMPPRHESFEAALDEERRFSQRKN